MKIITLIALILFCSIQIIFAQTKTSKTNKKDLQKIISVGIVNPKAIVIPKPQVGNIIHPKHLQISTEQIVAVQIAVDISGKVVEAKAILGHPMLRGACEYAARLAKFAPLLDSPPIIAKGLLIYKFKPDGTIDTDVVSNDKDVIGLPVNLAKPPQTSCNCQFGNNLSVIVIADIDEQGNVSKARAVSGHPVLRIPSEKAAIKSKFLPANIKTVVMINYNFELVDKYSVKISNIEVKKPKINK